MALGICVYVGGGKSSRDRWSFAASLVRERAADTVETAEGSAPVSGLVVVVPPATTTSAFSSGGDPPGDEDKSLGDKSPSLP